MFYWAHIIIQHSIIKHHAFIKKTIIKNESKSVFHIRIIKTQQDIP